MNTEVCLIRADTQPAGEAGKQPRHCRPPRAQRPDPSSWPPAEPHPTSGAPTDAGAGDMVGCRIRPHGSGPATSTEGSQPVPGPAPRGARHSPAPHGAAASPPPLGHAAGAGEPRGWTLGAPVLRGAPGAKAVLGQPRAPQQQRGRGAVPGHGALGTVPAVPPAPALGRAAARAVEIFPYPQHQVFFAVITTAIIISFGVFSCHNLSPALIYSAGLFREGNRRNGAIH